MRMRILAVAVLAASAACSERSTPAVSTPQAPPGPPPAALAPGPAAPARAAALESAAPSYQRVDAHRERQGGRTELSGYFDHGELRYLDEGVSDAAAPTLHNRYYFENGLLFYVRGEAPAGTIGGGPTALGATVPVRAEFAGAKTLSAVRIEHFGEVKLDAAAVESIRRQGAELASFLGSEQRATRKP